MEVRKSALVPFASDRMFDLIEAAEHYPEFLPWCIGARILERSESVVAAEIAVDYLGVRFRFTTRNPKRRPEWLAVALQSGPFVASKANGSFAAWPRQRPRSTSRFAGSSGAGSRIRWRGPFSRGSPIRTSMRSSPGRIALSQVLAGEASLRRSRRAKTPCVPDVRTESSQQIDDVGVVGSVPCQYQDLGLRCMSLFLVATAQHHGLTGRLTILEFMVIVAVGDPVPR